MHAETMMLMKEFISEHLDPLKEYNLLEVGSLNVNGSYRELFSNVKYTGIDVQAGPDVDIKLKKPYDWAELEDNSYDLIISGQCLEHVEFPWLVMEQIKKKMTNDAIICVIVPSTGPIHGSHGYGFVDAYRYNPDGLRALGKWVDLHVVSVKKLPNTKWGDVRAIYTSQYKVKPL